MKGGDWIPIDKSIIALFERPFGKGEAMISLRVDLDNKTVKGLREYARIWGWSVGKVERFFKDIGYKTGESLNDLSKKTPTGTVKKTPIRIVLNKLDEGNKTPKKTPAEHYYNPNTKDSNNNIPASLKKISGFIEIWEKWIQHRAEIKKPLTNEAVKMQFKKLIKFHNEMHDPIEIIENAIAGGWQGFFTPKGSYKDRGNDPHQGETVLSQLDQIEKGNPI